MLQNENDYFSYYNRHQNSYCNSSATKSLKYYKLIKQQTTMINKMFKMMLNNTWIVKPRICKYWYVKLYLTINYLTIKKKNWTNIMTNCIGQNFFIAGVQQNFYLVFEVCRNTGDTDLSDVWSYRCVSNTISLTGFSPWCHVLVINVLNNLINTQLIMRQKTEKNTENKNR